MGFSKFSPGCCCGCEVQLCVTVRTPCGPEAGAEVSIDEIYGDSCITDNAGRCCLVVHDNGTYTVRVTVRGFDYTQEVTIEHCQAQEILINVDPGPDGQICFTILGCPTAPYTAIGRLAGATVQLIYSAPTVDYQCTTDVNGQCCISVSDFLPRNVVVLPPTSGCTGFSPGGTDGSHFVTASDCGTLSYEFVLSPDGSHVCCGTVLISTTLHVSFGGFSHSVPWVGTGWQTCVLAPTTIFPGGCPEEPPFVPPQVPGNVAVTISISCLGSLRGDFLGLRVRLEWDSGYCVESRDPGTGENPVFKVFHTRTTCPVLLEDFESEIPCPQAFPYDDNCVPCVGSGLTGVFVDVPFSSMSVCPILFSVGMPTLTRSIEDPCGNPGEFFDVVFPMPGLGGAITVSE